MKKDIVDFHEYFNIESNRKEFPCHSSFWQVKLFSDEFQELEIYSNFYNTNLLNQIPFYKPILNGFKLNYKCHGEQE